MRGKRIFWFVVMIGLGALLGMIYGWIIHPLGGNESALKAMRHDYRADYVLMVAEVYAADGDLEQAAQWMAEVSDLSPAQTAAEALQSARSLDWAEADLEKLEALAKALQGGSSTDIPGDAPTFQPEAEEQP